MSTSSSSRHHYIPLFLIKGFKNKDGLLYVFDKQKNRILNKPLPPKSIFFEKDRNNINKFDGGNTSIIEEIYSSIDNYTSKVVKYYQQEKPLNIDFSLNNRVIFLYFLTTLFWRIPLTDRTVEDLLNQIDALNPNFKSKRIIDDSSFRKTYRVKDLIEHQINEIVQFGSKGYEWLNIRESILDEYIVGDNPILFRKIPQEFREFNQIDFMISLNSNRLYTSTNDKLDNLSLYNSIMYNVLIISQSLRYVASGNLDLLEHSVNIFNELKTKGLIHSVIDEAFLAN